MSDLMVGGLVFFAVFGEWRVTSVEPLERLAWGQNHSAMPGSSVMPVNGPTGLSNEESYV